jgi:hypothetical protein
MFKVHILVSEDTDVAAELASLERLAQKHHLDAMKLHGLLRNAETLLADLKQQDAETAAYGIKMALEKTLATEDYRISFQLTPLKARSKKGGLLSRLFGN